ncbi:MAG: malto-oligosyltrehalose trehalohydrolase [Spirochaetia bacterium]
MTDGPEATGSTWGLPAPSIPEPKHRLPSFVGAEYDSSTRRAEFCVWAPLRSRLLLETGEDGLLHTMQRDDDGYHQCEVDGCEPGQTYVLLTEDGRRLPDPASRLQPDGVHGPSALVDTRFFEMQNTNYTAPRLHQYVIYELHVGTFTAEGTFAAAVKQLPRLAELGITAVEILPVAAFAGKRNWGYDGVQPYAVQACYGGPAGLAAFVDAAHGLGIAVVLDVVYNHLGPEGNYLREFGPYFTDAYRTPWGEAINFDGPDSDEVRAYFIRNALFWLERYDIDALRLDAVHAIYDTGARPFLSELQAAVEEAFGSDQPGESGESASKRPRYLIAESDMNDSRLVRRRDESGFGLAGHWADDFHHAVHVLLTGERRGYYADFGGIEQLERAVFQAYNLSGGYSAHRRRRHGNSPEGVPVERFVVCIQNHDQVGNRMFGERLSTLVTPQQHRFAVSLLLLSPYVPLLFMGEEYGETRPFCFFVDHGDQTLLDATRDGRKREFAEFYDGVEPPDPVAKSTFEDSVLDTSAAERQPGKAILELYRELLRIRRESGGARVVERIKMDLPVIAYRRGAFVVLANCGESAVELSLRDLGVEQASVRVCTWMDELELTEQLQVDAGFGASESNGPRTAEGAGHRVQLPGWGVVVLQASEDNELEQGK